MMAERRVQVECKTLCNCYKACGSLRPSKRWHHFLWWGETEGNCAKKKSFWSYHLPITFHYLTCEILPRSCQKTKPGRSAVKLYLVGTESPLLSPKEGKSALQLLKLHDQMPSFASLAGNKEELRNTLTEQRHNSCHEPPQPTSPFSGRTGYCRLLSALRGNELHREMKSSIRDRLNWDVMKVQQRGVIC